VPELPSDTPIHFRSALDWWLFPSLFLGPTLFSLGIGAIEGDPVVAATVGAGLGVLLAGLAAYFTRGTAYVISNRYLTIQSGGLETIIDLAWIEKVDLARNAWLAPCRSVHRVRVAYKHGTSLVSPPNREAFLAELNKRRRQRDKTISELLR
jgi:hypothetical protein